MISGFQLRPSVVVFFTVAAFILYVDRLPAQSKPVSTSSSVSGSTTVPVQSSPQLQMPGTTTTLIPTPRANSLEKTYSIRVRASVVGIGKDAIKVGDQPGFSPPVQPAPQTAQSSGASLSDSLDSGNNFVAMLDKRAKWGAEQTKAAVPGTPIQVKLIGANIVSLIQLIPFENSRNTLDVVASGQVWIMKPDGTIQYRTTVSTLSVTLAERMFFFPLGYATDGSSPLVVEIIVDRLSK